MHLCDLFWCTSKGGQYLISLRVYIPWGVLWCFAGVPQDRSLCWNFKCCVLRPEFSYLFLGLCPRMRSLSSSSVCLSNLQALLSMGVCRRVWSLIHLRVRGPRCQICLWVSIRMWDIFSLMVVCLRCDSLSLYVCQQCVVSGLWLCPRLPPIFLWSSMWGLWGLLSSCPMIWVSGLCGYRSQCVSYLIHLVYFPGCECFDLCVGVCPWMLFLWNICGYKAQFMWLFLCKCHRVWGLLFGSIYFLEFEFSELFLCISGCEIPDLFGCVGPTIWGL